jgi:hypothetical protein
MNKLIFKYLGWLLYPDGKQGKEHRHKNLKNIYGK